MMNSTKRGDLCFFLMRCFFFKSDLSNYKAAAYDFSLLAKPSSLFCFVFFFLSLRTEQLILHEKTEAQHTAPQPALGRTRSSSRALLVPAARFPPLAARWSPSMRRERQIHIRVFPLTFHWLPQPLGLRAELLPGPVRTVGSSQTQKGAGF